MDKMSAVGAVRAGYASGVQPFGIARTFDENARAPIRSSDITVSATKLKSSATGVVTLAECPDGENWRVEYLTLRNVTAGGVLATVYLVPSGAGPLAVNNAVFTTTISARASVIINEAIGYQLLPGERLMALCAADDNVIAFARLRRITQGET